MGAPENVRHPLCVTQDGWGTAENPPCAGVGHAGLVTSEAADGRGPQPLQSWAHVT